ncbi:MAG: NAD(P)H-hydrate dehydratase [Pseudomonadota bacterium]
MKDLDDLPHELLTPAQMAEADRVTIASGVPGIDLMDRAGAAMAHEAADMLPDAGRVAILCGPGNNGGDGYVAARLLALSGYRVTVAALDPDKPLKGDAALAADAWPGPVAAASKIDVGAYDLIIDALFGTGLTRTIAGDAAATVDGLNAGETPVLSVDVPSGFDAADGVIEGPVVHADRTVTFFRLKPGHLLSLGENPCGDVRLHQIGIPAEVLDDIRSPDQALAINGPALWQNTFPMPRPTDHKYTRGHAVVLSGPARATGAARLAAGAALRVGAGLVTVASPPAAVLVNASHLTAVMIAPCEDGDAFAEIAGERRVTALCIGPGAGVTEALAEKLRIACMSQAALVLDADALTVVAAEPPLRAVLARRKSDPSILTPHAGEFSRLFPSHNPAHLSDVRTCAEEIGAVLVAKGPRTIIASPDGRAAINVNAPPTLATAGSGDVLAGFITGLRAQGMPAYEAACSGVWLHGACANAFGPGLIAEDIAACLPDVLRDLGAETQTSTR